MAGIGRKGGVCVLATFFDGEVVVKKQLDVHILRLVLLDPVDHVQLESDIDGILQEGLEDLYVVIKLL